MMPMCQGGLGQCKNVATFLGPHEDPALCDQHFGELLDRIQKHMERRKPDGVKVDHAKFNVRNEEVEEILRSLGHKIGESLPKGWGFMLTIQSYGENGSTFYISNCDRAGMIELLGEMQGKLRAEAKS